MQVAVGQDKSNGLVTFNQVKVFFFFFFFPSCQNVNTLKSSLLFLKNSRRSQGGRCPPSPPSGSASGLYHVNPNEFRKYCHVNFTLGYHITKVTSPNMFHYTSSYYHVNKVDVILMSATFVC